MENYKPSRRKFVKTSAILGAASALSFSALSYGRILGANDKINVALVGTRGRGEALLGSLIEAGGSKLEITALCDVDSRALAEKVNLVKKGTTFRPKSEPDFRKVLQDKECDAVLLATPDHTHAPFAIYAMNAGKHVYLEKPCSHNPYEGELLISAQKKTGRILQVGNQQRSAATSILAIKEIREGLIGRAYMGKSWYANNRGSIGEGKKTPPPDWLDWELWQGPAPRRDYQDNLVHYNWHWFSHWGTGEINNNGLHELDICRWALDVDFPQVVTSSGGRFHFKDDWEFYDTQIASYEFPDNKMISWEGRSCNALPFHGRGRGATIHGTEGSVLLDRNGYVAYNKDGQVIKAVYESAPSATTDLVGGGPLTTTHIANFLAAIREGVPLNSPIDDAHKSTLMCHLGNISQKFGRSLEIDTKNGQIKNDREAMKLWKREYQKGWEPKV